MKLIKRRSFCRESYKTFQKLISSWRCGKIRKFDKTTCIGVGARITKKKKMARHQRFECEVEDDEVRYGLRYQDDLKESEKSYDPRADFAVRHIL